MKEAPIIQFNCFSTQLSHNVFLQQWDHYTETEAIQNALLLKQSADTNGRFQYIARQQWEPTSVKRKPVRHFQEASVKMISAGGYILLDTHQLRKYQGQQVKLIAFMHINDPDIEPYVKSALYSRLEVYQAWYESCIFSYVLEFLVPVGNVRDMLLLLQSSRTVETGIYKECVLQVS